jgi:AcrR family transcriptional regulator
MSHQTRHIASSVMPATTPRAPKLPGRKSANPGSEKRDANANMAAPGTRQRLSPNERRRHLIQEATSYFAEVGFGGSTRELAKRIGVTQPLLYRYFPNKDDLIQAVYESVFLNRWRSEWTALIRNRSIALQDRLVRFYCSYSEVALTPEWLRIYLFSGLKGAHINRWYIQLIEERILNPIIRELYAERGHIVSEDYQPDQNDLEVAWLLQSAVFYYAIRKHIYMTSVSDDRNATIEQYVVIFMQGTTISI